VEVDEAAVEPAFLTELQIQPESGREQWCAATDHHRHEIDRNLVDQSGSESLSGEVGSANAEVGGRFDLELPHRIEIEPRLDPGARTARLGLSAACQIRAYSRSAAESACSCAVSQYAITSYIRRP
jgi:hypothetical protein